MRSHATENDARTSGVVEHDRLAARGADVVHDVNHMLAVISLTASALLADATGERRDGIEDILISTEIAAGMTRRFLDGLARGEVVVEKRSDVNVSVRRLERVLGRLTARRALTVSLSNEPADVSVDRTRVEQIVLNLVRNACDATDSRGAIVIRTRLSADWVAIEVEDDGAGLSQEVRARLFDRYVTSKPRGTGLGLSIVLAIVRAAGGDVSVEARDGGGSVFRVSLPRAPARPRVLVLDPEPDTRLEAARALEESGYHVVATDDPSAIASEPSLEAVVVAASELDATRAWIAPVLATREMRVVVTAHRAIAPALQEDLRAREWALVLTPCAGAVVAAAVSRALGNA